MLKKNTPWADSYWPKQRGAFSYRWREFQTETENQTMSQAERDAKFFQYHMYSKAELKAMAMTPEGQEQINRLSPMEKYSIYTGDYGYSLAKKYLNGRGNGPGRVSWEGYCHAWAPAASHYPEPAPTTVINKDNIPLSFGSGDVKALLVANYHEHMFPGVLRHGDLKKSYIGGSGCPTNVAFLFPTTKVRNGMIEMADYDDTDGILDSELEANVMAYQDGLKKVLASNPNSVTLPANAQAIANDASLPAKARAAASNPACMGVNPGTFHLVVANQLGVQQKGFELDKTRDGQIWNQPARGFTSRVVGYEPATSNADPRTAKVAIIETDLQYADDTDYGWTFWNPTLKGLFGAVDSAFGAEYNLYSRMLMNQGDEDQIHAYPYNIMDTVHYKYKLEIAADGKIVGGEWLTLNRPDTLWIMENAYLSPNKGFDDNFKELKDIYTPAQL